MSERTDFYKIKQFVFSETGLSYYQFRENELHRKIDKAFKRSGSPDYGHYLRRLRDMDTGSALFDDLVSELTIGETHFFRDEALFNAMKDVILPAVIKKNHQLKRLWIWSAGCATGEEVYTIAILLNTHFSHLLKDWDIRITGTDINRSFLHRALQGEYTDWSFRGTTQNIKESCFIRKEKKWCIRPEYKQHVSFQYHNLVKNPFPSVFQSLYSFDIIFCRNVMIYLDSETSATLVRQFQMALVNDGWLVVGHADHNPGHFSVFNTVMQPGTSLYRNSSKPEPAQIKRTDPVRMPFLPETTTKHQPRPVFNHTRGDLPVKTLRKMPADLQKEDKTEAYRPDTSASEQKAVQAGFESNTKELMTLINQGHWDIAKRLCKTLLSETPMDAGIHILSAFILEQEGHIEGAVDSLKKALYLDRQSVLGHYHQGLMFQKLGVLKKAEKHFANVIRLLDAYSEDYVFEMADGISAAQLKQLSEFHLEILKG